MSDDENAPFARLTHLGDLPVEDFLKIYWQKKPLLIRQALGKFNSPLTADEIAGFSLEDDVVSRLVVEHKHQWSVQHGPLKAEVFSQLPKSHWTLLVQHADGLEPRVNQMLNAFRFIPNWRLDDVMVSYAANGGGVGPHFDYFDVFLLQAEGRRRWRLGQDCSATSSLRPNQPMKILQRFKTLSDWVVEPGDLLYVPAKCAHWGQALGESITYSIGFRAPSHADFILDYSQELAARTSEDDRYQDPALSLQTHPGLISTNTIQQFQRTLETLFADEAAIIQWLGEFSTRSKHDIDQQFVPASIIQLQNNLACRLNPYSRVAYHPFSSNCMCFIDGHTWRCSEGLAIVLSEYRSFSFDEFTTADQRVLKNMTAESLIICEQEENNT